MTGNDLHASPRTTPSDPPRDDTAAVSSRLLGRARDAGHDATPRSAMDAVADDLLDGDAGDVSAPETLVTESLDEIMVALIALREDGTHGTGLMDDITQLFDVQPSPGTVYPRLHDLKADGTLGCHDLVRTKQYSIRDDDAAESLIEDAMYHHLSIGLFLRAALDAE